MIGLSGPDTHVQKVSLICKAMQVTVRIVKRKRNVTTAVALNLNNILNHTNIYVS